jgi:NAD(P)-dependent dehydrogenase (short-subunit alcohol dehydrogenase family)
MDLKGKIVLVSGSTDGVGRLVARQLADQGASLLIHGRDHYRGKQVIEQIQAAGCGSAVFLPADLASLAEVRHLAEVVTRRCDRLDILINNAGMAPPASERSVRTAMNYASPSITSPVSC